MATARRRLEGSALPRCYGCFRPRTHCFCSAIPTIHNETEVLIVQHVRERSHPFNTARIVHRALQNSSLVTDQTRSLAAAGLPLGSRAGLLYPGPSAQLLSRVPIDQRPDQLVIVDGTWHQAKTLVRDVPALSALPSYRLAPAAPGRYRIRREPNTEALSTLEATVAALRVLEPETRGFDQLVAAFNAMVERQLAFPRHATWRVNERRRRDVANIPRAIVRDINNVVVAYGESAARERGRKRPAPAPIYWVAERLGSGERFASAIQPVDPLGDALLAHLRLGAEDFASALSHEEFRSRWQHFLRPSDTLAVYHQSTVRLLINIGGKVVPCHVLKSVDFAAHRGTLEEVLIAEGIASGGAQHPGRAGERLAKAVALVRHLHALGKKGGGDRP